MSLLSNNSSISDEVTGGGRGTRVVSTVLYPRTVPSDGVYQLPCWIRNMRILDENNCHQEMCIRQRQYLLLCKKYNVDNSTPTRILIILLETVDIVK